MVDFSGRRQDKYWRTEVKDLEPSFFPLNFRMFVNPQPIVIITARTCHLKCSFKLSLDHPKFQFATTLLLSFGTTSPTSPTSPTLPTLLYCIFTEVSGYYWSRYAATSAAIDRSRTKVIRHAQQSNSQHKRSCLTFIIPLFPSKRGITFALQSSVRHQISQYISNHC